MHCAGPASGLFPSTSKQACMHSISGIAQLVAFGEAFVLHSISSQVLVLLYNASLAAPSDVVAGDVIGGACLVVSWHLLLVSFC